MNSYRIFSDVYPLRSSFSNFEDYAGYQIYSHCSLPLTKTSDGKTQPFGAKAWEFSNDGLTLQFYIEIKKYQWQPGENVTAHDYATGFNNLIEENSSRFLYLLRDVEGVSDQHKSDSSNIKIGIEALSEEVLIFHLKRPNYYLPNILSLPCFSPYREGGATPGQYKTLDKNKHQIRLERKDLKSSQKVNSIEFLFSSPFLRDPFALKAYDKGLIDRTCDLYFPYPEIKNYSSRPDFFRARSSTIMQLKPFPRSTEINIETRRSLFEILRKINFKKKLFNAPYEFFSYNDLGQDAQTSYAKQTRGFNDRGYQFTDQSCSLYVSYENFYPNHKVIGLISKESKKQGIEIIPIEKPYGRRDETVHFHLSLNFNPTSTPLPLYLAEVNNPLWPDKRSRLKYLSLINALQSTRCSIRRKKIYSVLDSMLNKVAIFFPILELPRLYLQRPHKNESSQKSKRHFQ